MKKYIRKHEGVGGMIFDWFNCVFMIFVMIIMLYPILNVLSVSLSSSEAITQGKVGWHPVGLNFNSYKTVFANGEIFNAYGNTILYAVVGTAISLLFTLLAAYAMAVDGFVLNKFFNRLLVFTMIFNGGLIPTYLVIKQLHLLDTLWVMVLPGSVTAYNLFICRTFFKGISPSLRESAYLDGANDFLICFRIYAPLSLPVLCTIGLFVIVGHWNSWFNALMYLNDENRYPLQMILRKIVVNDDVRGGAYSDSQMSSMMESLNVHPKNVQMASIMVAMVPILCVYPFLQKYFVKGVMLGSVKG